jgi:hypothetical protein
MLEKMGALREQMGDLREFFGEWKHGFSGRRGFAHGMRGGFGPDRYGGGGCFGHGGFDEHSRDKDE